MPQISQLIITQLGVILTGLSNSGRFILIKHAQGEKGNVVKTSFSTRNYQE